FRIIPSPFGGERIPYFEAVCTERNCLIPGFYGDCFYCVRRIGCHTVPVFVYSYTGAESRAVVVGGSPDIVIAVPDIAVQSFPYRIFHEITQAQTSVSSSAQRVGIHHTVPFVVGRLPHAAVLRVIDGSPGHIPVVFHFKGP